MTSANSSAPPFDQSHVARRLHNRRWVALLGILALLVSSGVSLLVLQASGASAAQSVIEPKSPPRENSFVHPASGNRPEMTSSPIIERVAPGHPLGLYGGTLNNSKCDPQAMVDFLQVHPDKAAAWASVEGITPADIPAYVADLKPRILRSDVAITTHGFENGGPTNVHAVVYAGTAVLVDKFGVPRSLCFCGNPLTPEKEVNEFVDDCQHQKAKWHTAQVKYPPNLTLELGQPKTYRVKLALEGGSPLPSGKIVVMPGTDPQGTPICVQCELLAKLESHGDSLEVDNKNWIPRTFTQETANWSWTVTARAAHDQELQLSLLPAVTTSDVQHAVLYANNDNSGTLFSTTQTFPPTQVHVNATRTQLFNQWWSESGKLGVVVIVSILAALASIIKWGGNVVRAMRNATAELRGNQKDNRP